MTKQLNFVQRIAVSILLNLVKSNQGLSLQWQILSIWVMSLLLGSTAPLQQQRRLVLGEQ